MTPALDDVHVVELGTYFAAPLAARHLAGFGCRVTRIERPAHARGAATERTRLGPRVLEALRRGKTCRTVDAKAEPQALLDILATADVVLENLAPGTADRLGVGYEAVRSRNPRVVYVSIPGFAPQDAAFDGVAAYESVVLAAAGILSDMGVNRVLLGVPASYTSLPMGSAYASVFAALAALAALHRQRREGPAADGEHIVVPMASAVLEALAHNSLEFPRDPHYMDLRAQRIAQGRFPVDASTLHALRDPFFTSYACADGRTLYVVCPAHGRHQVGLLRALGVADAAHAVAPQIDAYRRDPGVHGIGAARLSAAQASAVRPLLAAALLRRSAAAWEADLTARGIPVCAHRTTAEWNALDHVRESGLRDEAGDLAPIGWLRPLDEATEAPAARDDGAKGAAAPTAWPPARADGCFAGVRVLDCCNVIAGPTIGSMLARFGATVLKLDPVHPLYAPDISVIYGLAANAGKRSVLVDVARAEGRAVLHGLLADADVLLLNCTAGALERLDLTPSALHERHPRLVVARFDAFGGPAREAGGMGDWNGYDDCVQAGIGIQCRFGGGLETPEEHAHIGTIDVIAGVSGACSVAAALLARAVTGRPSLARSSLAAVGQVVQFPFSVGGAERATFGRGVACTGEWAGHRCVRARDGEWLLLLTRFAEERATDAAADAAAEEARAHALADAAAARDADAAVTWLRAQPDVRAAIRLARLRDLRRRHLRPAGTWPDAATTFAFWQWDDHPIGTLRMTGPIAMRMRGLCDTPPAPKYGADTRAVLDALDASTGTRIGLRARLAGAAGDAWSRTYLPYAAACDRCGARGDRHVLLPCAHAIRCETCALAAPSRCHVCGRAWPCATGLRARTAAYRRGYARWRTGAARGARDLRLGLADGASVPERLNDAQRPSRTQRPRAASAPPARC